MIFMFYSYSSSGRLKKSIAAVMVEKEENGKLYENYMENSEANSHAPPNDEPCQPHFMLLN